MNLEPSVVRWIAQQRAGSAGLDGVSRVGNGKVAKSGEAVTGAESEGLAPALAEVRHYLAVAQTVPRMRTDRVAELRAAIDQGTYVVPIDTLAAKLIGND